MNRDQCKAIIANIELIKHFAEGGDIAHCVVDYMGNVHPPKPTRGINLNGLHVQGCSYVRVKPKYRMDESLGFMVRVQREFYQVVKAHELIDNLPAKGFCGGE